MFDFSRPISLIVPVLVGLILLRLVIGLLLALTKRDVERKKATQRAWSQYTTATSLAAFFLPFFRVFSAEAINVRPLWAMFAVGLVASAVHVGWLSARLPKEKGPQPPNLPKTSAQAVKRAEQTKTNPVNANSAKTKPKAAPQPSPPIQASTSTKAPSEAVQPAPVALDRVISKWPLPPARSGPVEPVSLDRAESWYERQSNRLGRVLTGQELAAARLRLSTLKSMLLLGQIGPSEADGDVNMVLNQSGRG